MVLKKRDIEDNTSLSQMRFPEKMEMFEKFDWFTHNFVCSPYAPEKPIIPRNRKILTMGSCFAGNIASHLRQKGLDIIHFGFSERIFTTFALLDLFDGLKEGSVPSILIDDVPENAKNLIGIRETLEEGCVVILTLGISMCWFKKGTNELVYEPHEKNVLYDTSSNEIIRKTQRKGAVGFKESLKTYEMRPTGVNENRDKLRKVIDIIQGFNKDNLIVLTVSPVPLHWCQSDYPIIVGDFISKATLRLAVDGVMEERRPNVFYFPSFEIVRWALPHTSINTWGGDDGEPRHLNSEVVKFIVGMFEKYFIIVDPPKAGVS